MPSTAWRIGPGARVLMAPGCTVMNKLGGYAVDPNTIRRNLAASVAATRKAAQADRIGPIVSATKDSVESPSVVDEVKYYQQGSPWS